MTTSELLSESLDAALNREESEFDRLAAAFSGRFVLYGAGTLGRRILKVLAKMDVRPIAIADRDPRLRGQTLDGVVVLSVEDAVARYGQTALFVVSVFRGEGDEGMEKRVADLRARGCQSVTSFLPLAWKFPDELLPHYGAERPSLLLKERKSLLAVNESWADELSRDVFRAQLHWRLRADFSLMEAPSPDQYFPRDLFCLTHDEKIIDGGAFDGDTLKAAGSQFVYAWAVEPDPVNAGKLRRWNDARVEVCEYALGEKDGRAHFAAVGDVNSGLEKGGNTLVEVRSLDSLAPADPTFLKLDIEGAEMAALKGGVNLLNRTQLLAAVCIYHCPDHFWSIPLFLMKHLRQHSLFLRAHQNDGFELVCYAVPQNRLHRS